jgi:dolichol-phosphate mannosyltransferase
MIHVLLPAHNEEAALGRVLDEASRVLAGRPHHIWVVDDGSTDGTSDVAAARAGRLSLTIVRHEKNQGLGKALQTGIRNILPRLEDADVVVSLDADNTQPADLIPSLSALIEDGRADVAIASRFAPGGAMVGVPFHRRLTSLGARLVLSAAFRLPGVRDYTCGFRAYRGRLLREASRRWDPLITENGFAAQLEWLLKLSALSPVIVERPLVLRYDQKPTPSKLPLFRTIFRTVSTMARLRRLRQ